MAFPHKNIRLSAENYKGRRWHFLTICCDARRRVFLSESRAVWLIGSLWSESALSRFTIYAYSVMPDHVHALVTGLAADSDLLLFVRKFKQKTSSEFKGSRGAILWQKKFYDHILRPRDSVDGVAMYIWMNPVRLGICGDPKDYPYSGSFVLDWENLNLPRDKWVPQWKRKAPV
jgi:putative transposase